MSARLNPDGLNNLFIFKEEFGQFDHIKVLRVRPQQRLFVLIATRSSGGIISLWDDVEGWIPDNFGLYGHHIKIPENVVRFSTVSLNVGQDFRRSVLTNTLMWVPYMSGLSISDVTTKSLGGDYMRMYVSVYYDVAFTIYLHGMTDQWTGFIAPLSNPQELSQITPNCEDEEEVMNLISTQAMR